MLTFVSVVARVLRLASCHALIEHIAIWSFGRLIDEISDDNPDDKGEGSGLRYLQLYDIAFITMRNIVIGWGNFSEVDFSTIYG